MWTCRACCQAKPDIEFSANPRSSSGLHYYCRECSSRKMSESRMAARLKRGAVERVKAAMLQEQGGKCRTCPRTLSPAAAVADAVAGTGEVRGVLCRPCMAVLRFAHFDHEQLRRLAHYIETNGTSEQATPERPWGPLRSREDVERALALVESSDAPEGT